MGVDLPLMDQWWRWLEPWQWALVFKPLAVLLVAVLICAPVRWLTLRYLPEGRIKRLLLTRISE